MKRAFFEDYISQKSKSEFFSITDLVRIGNKWRIANQLPDFNITTYFNSKATQEFVTALENKYNTQCVIKSRGKGTHTWAHPLVFIDIALAINPKLKIEVYEWLFDNLLKYRNDSGVSYKKMCGALYQKYDRKSDFHKYIDKVARQIKVACSVDDWNTATQEQLDKRDKIHDNISLLCDVLNDTEQAVRLAIVKS